MSEQEIKKISENSSTPSNKELTSKEIEKLEEAKIRAKFPMAANKPLGGHSAFLQKRLAKGQKFFDSGDYNMARQKQAPRSTPAAIPVYGTGETIPTPETVPKNNKTHDPLNCLSSKNSEKIVLSTGKAAEDERKDVRDVGKEKPDGGWGWMVVFGVAISNMTTQSLMSTFGLLFLQKLSELEIGTTGASFILSIQTVCLNLSGLIIGPALMKFSFRKTAAAGAALVSGGLLLTTLADSLPVFVVTYSLFTGLGLGFLNPSTFMAIDSYFSSRKGRAVGLGLTGTGIGQLLLPILMDYLLREYGFHGTLLLLSGLALHALMGATLYQPVKWHLKPKTGTKPTETRPSKDNEKADNVTDRVKIEKSENEKKEERSLQTQCCNAMNIHLLKDPTFFWHINGLALVYVGNITFAMLLPFFLESIKFSRANIAICMTILSGADILGRIIIPTFTDTLKIKSRVTFFSGALLSALFRSVLVCQKTFLGTFIISAFCGFIRSAIVLNFNLSISELVPPDKLPSALGLHMLVKGAAVMIFANLLGYLRDYTKSYSFCVHVSDAFCLVIPFVIFLIQLMHSKTQTTRL